ncbi:Single-stranded DNA-binding protein DdrA [Planctomycetales bacterium 10988]|nr:Single-stranded DNA-binding protein DdrA [Planctomycetales bacterium 10988]
MQELQLAELGKPFAPRKVHWRVGSVTRDRKRGMALCYLDARDVMQRFDDVCGPENWQCIYSHAGDKTCCQIGVRVNDVWIWKSDGAGDTDFEGNKGAFSTAFKRAAVRWGVGRYLYDLGNCWVELQQDGRSIADFELEKLERILSCHLAILEAAEHEDKETLESYREVIPARKFGREVTQNFVQLVEERLTGLQTAA